VLGQWIDCKRAGISSKFSAAPPRNRLSIIFANSRKHSEIVGVSRDHRLLIRRDDHYNGGSDGGSDLAIPQIVLGGAGKDHISGGPCNDVLIGGHGKDKLSGGKGADILIGGDHKDKLKGGTGDDLLIGGLSGLADDDVAGSIAASTAWLSGILTGTRWNTPMTETRTISRVAKELIT
jgi:hypothetical protein